MADTLTLSVAASINWLFKEALDLSNVIDSSQLAYTASVADGTAVDTCDKIWHDSSTLASGASVSLDLAGGLTSTIFGSTVTITFVKVKFIFITNESTTAGEELRLDSSVANGFLGPFNGSATSKIEIGPTSCLLLSSKKDGWTVTAATGDILKLENPASGAAITYKIVIAGTSA